jgi:hypothetical protein
MKLKLNEWPVIETANCQKRQQINENSVQEIDETLGARQPRGRS